MNKGNNFGRLLVLLLVTLAICLGLYYMPNEVFGMKIKKVDLLSDLRVKPQSLSMDSLRMQLEQPDTIVVDSVALRDSVAKARGLDSIAMVVRDSLYRTMYAEAGADSLGTRIEDYSIGHIGLKRFFAALRNSHSMGRPVRVAFMGDSFIEGDIVVADFREALQKQFGGHGVGFIPVNSVAAQFRPTIEQHAVGWITHSLLTNKEYPYTLSGMLFEVEDKDASLSVKTTHQYPSLSPVSSLKLIYEQNTGTNLHLVCNGGNDTIVEILPATSATICQKEWKGLFTAGDFYFTEAEGFRALGVAMEDNSGVVVDNFSLRGNSGLIFDRLDSVHCENFREIRPYDLIILQYGLNVVSDEMLQYGWYRQRMVHVVRHIQKCFPESDILLLGVSDRGKQEDGTFETMPAVLALLHAQRQIAREVGIPFWNVFGAMGGENSMARYVENNWASKDYTHLSFRGGREIASALMKAILKEKEFYDEVEKENY